MLLNQTIEAAETTGNLLTNSDFEDGTAGWILSGDGVKIDGPYKDAGDTKIIRFKGQGSTISQLVNLTAVEEGKEILSYTISYHGYGCGNDANGHCTQENHDKIITNISFTDGSNTEVSSHSTSVIYEDGFTLYTFTKSINDNFLTGEVAINFELTGEDSHTGNNWLAPISDNYEFAITYQDYVVQQAVEEMIGGLDLSTEVTLDLIKDMQPMDMQHMEMVEMPMDMQPMEMIEMPINMPEAKMDMPDMIDVPMDMPPPIQEIRVEMPMDMGNNHVEVEPIQEIQEIRVKESPQQQPKIVETTDDRQEIKKEIASIKEAEPDEPSNIREEGDTKEGEGKTEESAGESKGDEKESKQVKVDTKAEVPSKPNASETKVKATLPVNTVKPQTIEQLPLPIAYLQIINDSISMVETVSLRQEQIYGGEQEYNLNTSSITIAGLDNNSSSRWSNLQNERKRFKAPKYVRRNK
tara:strand:- start:958 stop:2358 length:1401 start_codon:yes stop_codon:yes gene_type:complete